MNNVLSTKPNNCKNCYKCIRQCPVKSIRFKDSQASVVPDECVLCGRCYVVCPQNAKQIRGDVAVCRDMLTKGEQVYASIAPSFVANFPGVGIEAMKQSLLELGFADAQETALGATLVKNDYDDFVRQGKSSVVISSCCHSVNLLVQRHYPDLVKYLAPFKSPMQAHCSAIKRSHPECKTVFIGPCIAKKDEGDHAADVDCVLTFDELEQLFGMNNITPTQSKEQDKNSKARLFPTAGGILRTMKCDREDFGYLAIDGPMGCITALNDIQKGQIDNCFIEMSICKGSCSGGPVMKTKDSLVRNFMQIDDYAGGQDFDVLDFIDTDLSISYRPTPIVKNMPGSLAIAEIMRKMGKTAPEDELNCGCCGYDSCREKAIAVFQGKADLNMCLPFLKDKAESFSDNIIKNTPNGILVLDDQLQVQQINRAACDICNIRRPEDVLGELVIRILDPTEYFNVLQNGQNLHDKRVYLAEYGKYVEQSVIYDKSYRIVIVIMRDITDEESRKSKKDDNYRKTIEVTDKVIEKQMRVVQEIASLLGETTAETKIALTTLKESLNNE